MLEGVPEWKSNVATGGVLLEMLAVALLIMGWLWVDLLPEGVLMMAVGAGLLLSLVCASGEDEVGKLRREVSALRSRLDAAGL